MTAFTGGRPATYSTVKVPATDLGELLLPLLRPLLDRLGPTPSPEDISASVAPVTTFWNARLHATGYWGSKRVKQLADVRKQLISLHSAPGAHPLFEQLEAIWRAGDAAFDPRLVVTARYETSADGAPRIVCTHELPRNVYPAEEVPLARRICMGGQFLDEVSVPTGPSTAVGFPATEHRASVDAQGGVTVRTKAVAALRLFATAVLPPIGAGEVDLIVLGEKRAGMRLVRIAAAGVRQDDVELVFEPTLGR